MPAAAEIARLARLLADFEDLRVRGHAADKFMDLQFAEAAAEIEVLLRGQLLVAEEDDLMLKQCGPYRADDPVGEIARQIHARDFGAERAGDRLDLDRALRHVNRLRSSA